MNSSQVQGILQTSLCGIGAGRFQLKLNNGKNKSLQEKLEEEEEGIHLIFWTERVMGHLLRKVKLTGEVLNFIGK